MFTPEDGRQFKFTEDIRSGLQTMKFKSENKDLHIVEKRRRGKPVQENEQAQQLTFNGPIPGHRAISSLEATTSLSKD